MPLPVRVSAAALRSGTANASRCARGRSIGGYEAQTRRDERRDDPGVFAAAEEDDDRERREQLEREDREGPEAGHAGHERGDRIEPCDGEAQTAPR